MRRRLAAMTATALLGLAAAAPRPAAAYVRYATGAGVPFAWPQRCVSLTAYPDALTDLPSDHTLAEATAAAAAWTSEVSCTSLAITVTGSSAAPPASLYDGRSTLRFRTDDWCPSADGGQPCYDPEAMAITTLFVHADGFIRDADIEVNATNFTWADLVSDPDPTASKQDLRNTLTHELGHLIGLDHPCYLPTGQPRPVDDQGQPVPDCDAAPAEVRESTLYPSSDTGDLSKRTLSDDDRRAVCDIYPAAAGPTMCAATDGDDGGWGCQAAGTGRPAGAAALLLGLALLARARRRG